MLRPIIMIPLPCHSGNLCIDFLCRRRLHRNMLLWLWRPEQCIRMTRLRAADHSSFTDLTARMHQRGPTWPCCSSSSTASTACCTCFGFLMLSLCWSRGTTTMWQCSRRLWSSTVFRGSPGLPHTCTRSASALLLPPVILGLLHVRCLSHVREQIPSSIFRHQHPPSCRMEAGNIAGNAVCFSVHYMHVKHSRHALHLHMAASIGCSDLTNCSPAACCQGQLPAQAARWCLAHLCSRPVSAHACLEQP